MAVSKAQQKAVNKYMAANYDRINLTVPKGRKEEIQAFAAQTGESVNGFINRAIGEAMAVMMVSGNVANMPSLFQSVRFLTTAVASEMAYSEGLQQQALFSIALVLYLFILMVNAILNSILKKDKEH